MLLHSHKSTGIKELTDINALAEEYLRLSYHAWRTKDSKDAAHKSFNVAFKTDLDPNIPWIHIVPQGIGKVLLNLFNSGYGITHRGRVSGTIGNKITVRLKRL